ncbi:MAG: sulfatase [Verrucomicrobiae bacterium]|nr:sulfatase [Verrucomicrobiae bacterium]
MLFSRILPILLAASWFFAGVAPAEEKQPNILVILTDDHRYDALGFLGHPFLKTPNLDRIAREGIHFANAFVTTSLCSPSRASILTGLYAHNHGVVDNYNPLPKGLTFFPEYLQKAGYETAFIGKWHMGGEVDDPQPGFDHWISFKGQGVYFDDPAKGKVKGRFVPQAINSGYNIDGDRKSQDGYITDELSQYGLDWLRQRSGEKPWLLYLSHKAVHADFIPANRHAYQYENEPWQQPKSWFELPDQFHDVPMWVKNQRNSRHGVQFAYYTNLDLATYYRRYCETLLAVDETTGDLLAELEKRGELDDTIVLYLGDNGFQFGEHGLIDKRCAYEESMRIPMLMRAPMFSKGGRTVEEVVANIDIAPTLLEAAGLPVPDHMDGRSFLPLVKGEPDVKWRDYLLYEYYWERNYPQTPTMHALRGDRFKYVRYQGIWDVDELYDLKADEKETHNLINDPEYADTVTKLNARLFEILEETNGKRMPILNDRGTKFLHRKKGGTPAAEFPEWFERDPDPPFLK